MERCAPMRSWIESARLASRLLEWLLPGQCRHCAAAALPAAPLCAACAAQLEALPTMVGQSGHWSAFPYEGPARSLVRALKYRGGAALAPALAELIACRAPPRFWNEGVLVPVPAHPRQAAARGFNQARLLADALGARLNLPVCDLIARRAGHAPQTGANRRRRLALTANAFALVAAPGRRLPANVVLLDDVRTTGVTLEVCASLLSTRFHGEIRAVTFASVRAMHHPRGSGRFSGLE